jgi:ABC-2 type transport system permease protein
MAAAQLRAEFIRLLRSPEFTAFTLAFPTILYLFVGTQPGHLGGIEFRKYALASLAAYAAVNVALFAFGVSVATDRLNRTDALMKASPLRPGVVLLAKTLTAIAFAAAALAVLYLAAAFIAGVRLDAAQYVSLTARLLVGMLTFIAMGFTVGYLVNPGAAVAVVNLLFLPMSFASGIFVPIQALPKLIQDIAPYLPMYHYGRVAWNALGVSYSDLGTSVLWLAGYTIAFIALAVWAQRRDELRRFA